MRWGEFIGALSMFIALMVIGTSEMVYEMVNPTDPNTKEYFGVWWFVTRPDEVTAGSLITAQGITCSVLTEGGSDAYCGIDNLKSVCGAVQAFSVLGIAFSFLFLLIVTGRIPEIGSETMLGKVVRHGSAFVAFFSFIYLMSQFAATYHKCNETTDTFKWAPGYIAFLVFGWFGFVAWAGDKAELWEKIPIMSRDHMTSQSLLS